MEKQEQSKYIPFAVRFNLPERKAKFEKQKLEKPNFIPLIIERHPKSKLPHIDKSRFVCERLNKFIMVKTMIQTKVEKITQIEGVKKEGKTSFFMYVKNNVPNPEQEMGELYEKYKAEDGFLYVQYGQMETFGSGEREGDVNEGSVEKANSHSSRELQPPF